MSQGGVILEALVTVRIGREVGAKGPPFFFLKLNIIMLKPTVFTSHFAAYHQGENTHAVLDRYLVQGLYLPDPAQGVSICFFFIIYLS